MIFPDAAADLEPGGVRVGEDDDAGLFGHNPQKLQHLLVFKDGESAGGQDGPFHKIGKVDFVVFALHNNGHGTSDHPRPPSAIW